MKSTNPNRIRYRTTSATSKDSIQVFGHPSNGARYIVRLADTMWYVLDEESELVATSGFRVNQHIDLKRIKEALRSLGIMLPIEIRKPRVKKLTT